MTPASHFPVRKLGLIPLILLSLLIGCGPAPFPDPAPKPFANTSLILACDDAGFAPELANRAAFWSARTGAKIRIVKSGSLGEPAADGAILLAPDAPALAAQGKLLTVPAALRQTENGCKWDGIIDSYRMRLTQWGTLPYALPITAEGFATVYRADWLADPNHQVNFRTQTGQRLEPPRTWEDIARLGAYFTAALMRPALPPLPLDARRFLTQYHQIVACFDRRPAQFNDLSGEGAQAVAEGAVTFHVNPTNQQSRLLAPPFVAAAEWLANTRPSRPAEVGDSLQALAKGEAVVAVLTLEEIAQLPKINGVIDPRFGVTGMPGTTVYWTNPGKLQMAAGGRNYVPFLGTNTRVGVVYASSKSADTLWDFFAELAGPSGSATTLSQAPLGSGPFRIEHTTEGQDRAWENYGFDAPRTQQLTLAMREFAPFAVINPALILRTPDQAERMAELERAIRKVAAGLQPVPEALKEVTSAWQQLDQKNPERVRQWQRKAVGLD